MIRALHPGDEAALEAFLAPLAASSMFLRSNARAAGLVYAGERYQGTWAAAFDGDGITAVACQAWNGNLLLQAPVRLPEVARAAATRPVRGLVGPWEQVEAARDALGLRGRSTTLDSTEDLFDLPLVELVVPPTLRDGALAGRRAEERDIPEQIAWRRAYNAELFEGRDEDEGASVRDGVAAGTLWVVEHRGIPVSTSAFNATLPDCVQVGGVYTPPALRGRGFGRAAVATSLLDARAEGAQRAILFTDKGNAGAQGAYRALGFRVIGEYGLVLFR